VRPWASHRTTAPPSIGSAQPKNHIINHLVGRRRLLESGWCRNLNFTDESSVTNCRSNRLPGGKLLAFRAVSSRSDLRSRPPSSSEYLFGDFFTAISTLDSAAINRPCAGYPRQLNFVQSCRELPCAIQAPESCESGAVLNPGLIAHRPIFTRN
jgi:hypothetical protein